MRGCQWVSMVAIALMLSGCGGGDEPSTSREGGDGQDLVTASGSRVEPGTNRDATDRLFKQALARIAVGDARAAVELLSQILGNDPDNAKAYALRADIYARRRQDANALADFSAAIRVDPKNPRWLNSRGYFLITRGRRVEALRDLDAAIGLKADYAEALNNRGLAHVGAQDYKRAIADFDAAVAARPKFADAWNNRGFAYFRSDDDAQALADFNQALVCNPGFVMAYNNRALLRMDRKEYRQAVADCTEAIKRETENPRFYHLRRAAYRKLGKSKEALADTVRLIWLLKHEQLSRRIAAAPDHAQGYLQRANHLAADGRTGAALADYQRAITVEPGKAVTAYLARAEYWIARKQWDRALGDCEAGIKAGAKQRGWSLRGEVWRGKGEWDKAIADFVRARRFDGAVAETYFRRGEVHRKAGREKAAAADFKRAAELDSERFPEP